jgi:hypothetical protein
MSKYSRRLGVAGGLLSAAVAYFSIYQLAESLQSRAPSLWYFPGDPPVFDLLLAAALIVLLAAALTLALCGYWRKKRRQHESGLVAVATGLGWGLVAFGVLLFLPAAVVIGHRHVGQWANVRELLLHYNAEVASNLGGRRDIPMQDYAQLDRKLFGGEPVTYSFRGLARPVRLRLMSAAPPYVGLDFGGGANAILEPVTMLCIYSD